MKDKSKKKKSAEESKSLPPVETAESPASKADSKEKDKGKKNTSLRLDKPTLKALKIKAIEQETSVQKLIESLIQDYLKNDS